MGRSRWTSYELLGGDGAIFVGRIEPYVRIFVAARACTGPVEALLQYIEMIGIHSHRDDSSCNCIANQEMNRSLAGCPHGNVDIRKAMPLVQ